MGTFFLPLVNLVVENIIQIYPEWNTDDIVTPIRHKYTSSNRICIFIYKYSVSLHKTRNKQGTTHYTKVLVRVTK